MLQMSKHSDAAFYSVAARLETEVQSPGALLITSALDRDGTTMVTSQLAAALATEGYRVVVVNAADQPEARPPSTSSVSFGSGPEQTSDAPAAYAEFALRDPANRFAGSGREVAALLERLRARYDYTLVDAPSFNRGSMPMLFAHVCDALLIAVVLGRSVTPDDRRVNAFLDGGAKPVLGIVSTTKSALRHYELAGRRRRGAISPSHDNAQDRAERVPVITGSL